MKRKAACAAVLLTSLVLSSLPAVMAGQEPPGRSQVFQEVTAEAKVSDKPVVRIDKSGNLAYVVGSVFIKASRETVWNRLSDYDRATEIFDNLAVCKVVGTEGETKLLRQMVKPASFLKFDYIVNLNEEKPRLITWYRRSGSFKEVRGAWELDETEAGTIATYKIHLDGGVLLPSWLLNAQVKDYLPTVLLALKKSVERAG